ncbi:head maturation protease, ClpP-related [Longimicrobium sp.]|jgi:ATP-dependent protease ClpP protease subunit|uniref:head maturation protease, ClpP-related n=1 Tax=Longimicrobium sp. TaxID=2029185 RepID=UPI002F9308CC
MRKTIELPAQEKLSASRKPIVVQAKAPAKWYELKAAASGEAELFIYGEIGNYLWDGPTVGDLVRALSEINAGTIRVRINSPGGDVWGGIALYNALVQHPARIITQNDGVAASIASLVFMAGDERRMGTGTTLMVHDPWTCMCGNAADFREIAGWLDGIAASMADIYAERTGQTTAGIAALMTAETWMNAAEAVAAGFADDTTNEDAPPQMRARFDLSFFAHAPPELADRRQEGQANTRTTPQTVRDVEQILRDAGCSHAQAKAIASGGFKAKPDSRDENGGEPDDTAAADALMASLLTARFEFGARSLLEN